MSKWLSRALSALLLVALIMGGSVVVGNTPQAQAVEHTLTLRFPTQAQFALYLYPDLVPNGRFADGWDASGIAKWKPILLYKGSTDSFGTATVSTASFPSNLIDDDVIGILQGTRRSINVMVMAVNADLSQVAHYNIAMPLNLSTTIDVPLQAVSGTPSTNPEDYLEFVSVRCLPPNQGPDGLQNEVNLDYPSHITDEDTTYYGSPSGSCAAVLGEDPEVYWVKMAVHNVSLGLESTWRMDIAKETRTEVYASVACSCGQVNGWATENVDRGFKRTRTKDEGFHHVRYALYEYNNVLNCGFGLCWDEKRIGPWTGKIGISDYIVQSEPNDQEAYNITVAVGEQIEAYAQENKEFGVGVVIYGVGLKSQTGYSESTYLSWIGETVSTGGCSRKLWGADTYVSQTDVIWSSSTCQYP